MSAGAQVVGVEFVAAGAGQAEFAGGGAGAEVAGAMAVEEMPDQRSRQTMDELVVFMRRRLPEEEWIYRFETATGQG